MNISRDEFHDKAWALLQAKTFDDTQLAKVNIHTIRAVFNAVFDAGSPTEAQMQRIAQLEAKNADLAKQLYFANQALDRNQPEAAATDPFAGPCPGCLPTLNPPPGPGETCCVCDYTAPTLEEVERLKRRPNPAHGAPKPPGHNPVA